MKGTSAALRGLKTAERSAATFLIGGYRIGVVEGLEGVGWSDRVRGEGLGAKISIVIGRQIDTCRGLCLWWVVGWKFIWR